MGQFKVGKIYPFGLFSPASKIRFDAKNFGVIAIKTRRSKMKQFKVIIEGPPGSGKTTFINDLIRIRTQQMGWQERYRFKRLRDHKILVTSVTVPVPTKQETKKEE